MLEATVCMLWWVVGLAVVMATILVGCVIVDVVQFALRRKK